MLQYERIGITVKSGMTEKNETVQEIVALLEKEGATVLFDHKRQENVPCAQKMKTYEEEKDIDLLVVIGGDGTILRTMRELTSFSVPILGVNKGTVGFLAELNIDEIEEGIPALVTGSGVVEQRSILDVRLQRGSETPFCGFALNEAVIAQGMIARLVELKTNVNDEPLTTFNADGLIISTPTGSTAYSLAAGGPIVHPGLQAMILTPINPYSFSQKPLVVRGDSAVDVEVMTKPHHLGDTEVYLTVDGQTAVPLQKDDHVSVTTSPNTMKFLRRNEDSFFGTIREKLKWGEK